MENNYISSLKNLKKFNNVLLKDLSDHHIEQLSEIIKEVKVEKGDMIIREGEISDDFFIIQEGELDVVKIEKNSGEYFHLVTLSVGDNIGEVALLDNEPRSASVIATKDSVLFRIGLSDLNSISSANDSAASHIKINLAREMGQRLRRVSDATVTSLHNKLEEAAARVALGTVISWMLVGICVYVLGLQWLTSLANKVASTTVISVTILFVFALMSLAALLRSGYPLSFYGLNFRNWKRVHVEAVIYSIPLLLLIVFFKWLLIQFYEGMADSPLLDWSGSLHISPLQLAIDITIFALFTPVQEFIARGAVQSAFQAFLSGKNKTLYAILIANMMFSMIHVHLSTVFAIIVFIPGLFWGWMYNRQRTLVGVSISHTIISLGVYYVIGFQELL